MVRLRRQHSVAHIVFLAGLGLSGWLGLLTLSIWSSERLVSPEFGAQWWATVFLVACARLLSFQVFRTARIAIDSAFYITSVFLCGAVAAAELAALVLTIDGIAREIFGIGGSERHEDEPLWYVLALILYKGGLPSLVMLLIGTIFSDVWLLSVSDADLIWTQPLFYIAFLLVHYVFAGSGHWLEGESQSSAIGNFVIKVIGAELVLLPLSLAMVLAYRHGGIGLYLLLGLTGLMTNAIFRKVVMVTNKSQRRADELATLNEVGRIIAASLERDQLLKNLATVTVQLVGHTSRFMIGLVDEESQVLKCQLYDESGARYSGISFEKETGLTGYVMSTRKALLIADLQQEYGRYADDGEYFDPRFRSWLGIPLLVYDEVVGVMAVKTQEPDAYSRDDLRVLTTIADQAAVALENARLYELATVDGLTGLFVRRYFDHRLTEEWDRSGRYETPFAVALFDLDNFKGLNDTYGHQVGDEVLRVAAGVVRANMRTFDVAARYGGEEFGFIYPRTDLAEARKVAERIRSDLEKATIQTSGGEINVTASIGLAVVRDTRFGDPLGLVARADAALYEAKRLGKNRVYVDDSVGDPAPTDAEERTDVEYDRAR